MVNEVCSKTNMGLGFLRVVFPCGGGGGGGVGGCE